MKITQLKYCFLFLIAVFVNACSDSKNHPEQVSLSGSTMGTTYSIKIVMQSSPELTTNLKSKVDSILNVVNAQMSTYIPSSEISVFNSNRNLNWFQISHDFLFVLDQSIKLGKRSSGALDITIEPLVNLWGFGPEIRDRTIPATSEIKKALDQIGLEKIEINLENSSIRKLNTGLMLDLSATAKGFGVDKIYEFLSTIGIENYLIEIGGEIRVRGKNQFGEPWKVGISKPDATMSVENVVELVDGALATSGDYWNYFEENGVRYSHTIDPRTGYPISHKLASVSVIDSTCLSADGLATAINVMGPEEGYEFAVKAELPVYMIVRTNDTFITKQTPKFSKLVSEKEK